MKQLILSILLAAGAAQAAASDFQVYGMNGGGSVFVWKNKKAHDEALSLIAANVHKSNPAMVLRLLSCIVPSGTKVVVTDMGFVTHDILVVDGAEAGCRGNIPTENLKPN